MTPKMGILLMAYGAAHSLEDIEPYLMDIRGGRTPSRELVDEVTRRYQIMGGKSPLLDITRQQAHGLEKDLASAGHEHRVYIGMRHWHPFIQKTVEKMAGDGIDRIVALCLTPYYSKMSVGAYESKLQQAVSESGRTMDVVLIKSWNDHPILIDALSRRVNQALARFPDKERNTIPILFTAHSLPERILKEKDPYPGELQETVGLIMKNVEGNPHRLAYQSQGRTPEPWLGPDAGVVIDEWAAQGHRSMVLAPIGFISDHMETLFDVDVMYREQCGSKGIRMERSGSLNADPLLIQAMVSVIQSHLIH